MSTQSPGPEQELRFDGSDERAARARNSMLWAAYGDALGFISELADERALKRRTRGAPLDHPMAWTRRVGGRFGVDVELPAGCWSDDTQLRLATSRAIGPNGFDVESFAKVELPVWPSYALGGGRASKAAAQNLGKADTLWYANTFPGWTDAGGNGAAMRVQPHVWASKDLAHDFAFDVIVNAACTHGHPRAIAGALFHAGTLAHCMRLGRLPSLEDCLGLVAEMSSTLESIASNRQLGSTWLGLWERATGLKFASAWEETLHELRDSLQLALVPDVLSDDLAKSYAGIIRLLGLQDPERRGSGLLTPIAAVALAVMAPNPHSAVAAAAGMLATDTDTIATMAGALLGACSAGELPPAEPLDSSYLSAEADRLTAMSLGKARPSYSYPDVLSWVAPATQADALVADGGDLLVEGLGRVTDLGKAPISNAKGDFSWQWVRTAFGQTLLIKRRPALRPLLDRNTLLPPPPPEPVRDQRFDRRGSRQQAPKDRGVNLDSAIRFAREHIDDNGQLGYTVRRVARDGSVADLVALLVAVREDLRRP